VSVTPYSDLQIVVKRSLWSPSVVTFSVTMLTGGARSLRVLLSYAVGCLLGDVFLHLLPEVWMERHDAPVGESSLLSSSSPSVK
jgi:hypothetical protein